MDGFQALGGFGMSLAGVNVNEGNSLRNMAVMACVSIISQSLASVPLILYERTGERTRRRAVEHPLYSILHDQGNREMTAFEVRETRLAHCALWGNAYAEIEYDDAMNVVGLWPLSPDRVGIERDKATGQLMYTYIMPDNTGVVLPAWRVSHLRYMVIDGVTGVSPVRQAMNAIGLAQATEEFGSAYFRGGARPSIIIKAPSKIQPETYQRIRASFQENWGGLNNASRVQILEGGLDFATIGIPNEEAQFLETRRFQVSEIARLYRVPLDMLADSSTSTYGSAEQHAINLRTYTLLPWARRDEQAVMRDLLTPSDRQRYYAEYLLDGLERADIGTRSTAFNTMRQGGAITANEWRAAENMAPIDGGDVLLQPMNMAAVNGVAGDTVDSSHDKPVNQRAAFEPVFQDAAKRASRRLAQDIRKVGASTLRSGGPEAVDRWLGEFFSSSESIVEGVLAAATQAQAIQAGVDGSTATRRLNKEVGSYIGIMLDGCQRLWRSDAGEDVEQRLANMAQLVESNDNWLATNVQQAILEGNDGE